MNLVKQLTLFVFLLAVASSVAQLPNTRPQEPVAAVKPDQSSAVPAPSTVTVATALTLLGSGERVKVRGMLLMETAPGFLFLKDDTGRIRVRLVDPVNAKAGDVLEIVADPVIARGAAWLENGEASVVEHGQLPSPLPMKAKDAYASPEDRQRLDGEFVSLRGLIVGHSTHKDHYRVRGVWTEVDFPVLEIDDEGVRVRVFFPPSDHTAGGFRIGTLASFAGTCRLEPRMPDDGGGQVHLLLPDASNVSVLKLPPIWDSPGFQQALRISLLVLGCVIALGLAWALGQRRKVKALRASEERYRILNQSLEKRVEERTAELAAALTQQTELAKLKTNFVSLVSHEFRTPLGVIMSASDVLQRYFERLTPEKRERHLDMIISSTRNLAALVEEVLILGRVEEGRLHVAPASIDLEKICHTLCDEMQSATKGTNPIHFRALPSLDGAVSDESLLRHIVCNLLSNAVKYSEPGNPVQFTVERRDTNAVLTFQDHGIGIPEEDQARLFTSFSRGTNVGQRPGTGLGLLVVQRCVALHGGTLDLKSAVGTGTTVTVTLPVFKTPLTSQT